MVGAFYRLLDMVHEFSMLRTRSVWRQKRSRSMPTDVCSVCPRILARRSAHWSAGAKKFIYELRQTRRLLGRDLCQGGVAAAPAIYALRHNILLLNEDNRRAEKLAEAIQGLDETRVRRVFHLGISEEDYGKDNSDLQDR